MNLELSSTVFWRKCQTLVLMLLLGTLGGVFSASGIADASIPEKADASKQEQKLALRDKELKDKWGIELIAMRSTAYGHMVDFRYRVLDAEKAAPLFVRKTKPYLIHQESGKALAVPNTAKLGSLRNSNIPPQGRTYWLFFGNSQGLIHKGDKVTVAIGDFRATDIEVE